MPNHVTNYLRGPREVIHALLTEDGVTFERIIPMPDDVIRGGIGKRKNDAGEMVDCWYETTFDEDGKPTGQVAHDYDPATQRDWYSWSIENWGTKWDAYSDEVLEDDTVVRFDTAWSHPYPVIFKLSQMFPQEYIQVMYADEDLGSNFGVYVIRDGQIAEVPTPEEGSPAAVDIACLIKYGQHYEQLNREDDREDLEYFNVLEVMRHALHGTGA